MQQEQTTRTERTFGDNGETIEETVIEHQAEPSAPETEIIEESNPAPNADHKYRIGDKTFATQEEALTYATSQVSNLEQEQLLADAYRQGIKDAAISAPSAANVTQAEPVVPDPDIDETELYTNPKEFLKKYGEKISTHILSNIDRRDAITRESDQIWSEFSTRHPMLADFRQETESFVAQNQELVATVAKTKGRPAAIDWVATKMKSKFESYASAVRPARTLPNGVAGASPTSKVPGVTPKPTAKKPSTFIEEVRSLRKRR